MTWRRLFCSFTLAALCLAPASYTGMASGRNLSPEAAKILIYADDYYRGTNTFVDQALTALGLSATAYHSNQPGFIYDLGHSGPWDLVIFAHEFYALDGDMYEALNKYASEGGRLIVQSLTMSSYPTAKLWETMGVTFVSDDLDPPDPVYWWKPGYPAFAYPNQMPEFTSLVSRSNYTIYGQYVQPRAGFRRPGLAIPHPILTGTRQHWWWATRTGRFSRALWMPRTLPTRTATRCSTGWNYGST